MLTNGAETILGHLYLTAGAAALAGLPDADLLRRFSTGGGAGESAFAALLHRHGPSVLRVCRSVLRNTHDAEDAFQATFLVLAAKARSLVLRGPLGLWLYEVARRVSLQARAAAMRRQRHEQRAGKAEAVAADAIGPDSAGEVLASVSQLPERFRAAIVLCDLEGLSYAEAADKLGWTHATLRNRLARGRERLRVTLVRKGLAPVTALAAGAVPSVSRALAAATVRAAVGVAAGTANEWVPATVIALMNGGLRAMLYTKLKVAGLSFLAAGAIFAGAHGLTARGTSERMEQVIPAPTAPAPPSARQPAGRAPLSDAWIAKLKMLVPMAEAFDSITLSDALSYLNEKCDVTIIVNVPSFEAVGQKNIEATKLRLPKMPGVSLGTHLRFLCAQLPGTGDFVVRGDHLEVVPRELAIKERAGISYWPRSVFVPDFQPHPRAEAVSLVARLNEQASIDKAIDGIPLKDVLDFLSDKYNVTFIINEQAFEEVTGSRNIGDTNIRLPKMLGINLNTVLRHLLAQLPNRGAYLIRGDHVEITLDSYAKTEAFGIAPPWDKEQYSRLSQQLVNVESEQQPLATVLAGIARQSGQNVILDARVTASEKLVITASLLNTPIETAVRVLAEMCNLKSVRMDNVFFVTTREHAGELQKEEDKQAEARAKQATPAKAPTVGK